MVGQSTAELTQHQEALNQREASLQGRMDHMLNQRRVSMEQEFERRHVEIIEACRADFRSKTDAALVRYKQGRETLECQVRDLETELRGAHEVRRGAERALAEADATITSLWRDVQRLEEEKSASVLQVVEISRELQEVGTPKRKHACCEGSVCRCSVGSPPASWRRRTTWASTG
jgi:chromosome segregation ATPase